MVGQTHLSVHEDVDDGVEDRAALGQIHGKRGDQWVDVEIGIKDDSESKRSVRQPREQEGQDHHSHHARHLHLSLRRASTFGHLQLGNLEREEEKSSPGINKHAIKIKITRY